MVKVGGKVITFGGAVAVARVSKYEISQVGDTIDFTFVLSKIHFFDKETEECLFCVDKHSQWGEVS